VLHTNHVLVDSSGGGADADDFVGSLADSTHARLASLRARVTDAGSVQAALAAVDDPLHPVCRRVGLGPNFTFASTVMECSTAPRLHAAAGPPDAHPYPTLTFASLD
jgi:hypothetical protein